MSLHTTDLAMNATVLVAAPPAGPHEPSGMAVICTPTNTSKEGVFTQGTQLNSANVSEAGSDGVGGFCAACIQPMGRWHGSHLHTAHMTRLILAACGFCKVQGLP